MVYDNKCVNADLKRLLSKLNLGKDVSYLVDGYRYSKELKPIYDEIHEKLWDIQVRSVIGGNIERYKQSVKFQEWLNLLASSINNSCLFSLCFLH